MSPQDIRVSTLIKRIKELQSTGSNSTYPCDSIGCRPAQTVLPTTDSTESAIGKLERLRGWRTKSASWRSVAEEVETLLKSIKRTYNKLQKCIALWEEHVDPALAMRSSLVSLRNGVLTVSVTSSATLFELDRHLREGVLQRMCASGILHQVRLKFAEEPREAKRGEIPPHVYALLEDWELPGSEWKPLTEYED